MSGLLYEILKFVGLLAGFGLLVFLVAYLLAWLSGNGGEDKIDKVDKRDENDPDRKE